ncbi:hypothetical protein NLU13_7768 [Sarocladium strictum]|uniref:Glucose-methanol-choline oxidoreductase N-terminal domain-containing protein n=1 Tax=Sarocladium strictum TaxID=5046 RepID=A0AA39L5W7_SARSR|nr:hypothetical protein NLU13_7768 [Sarocladium strictum]
MRVHSATAILFALIQGATAGCGNVRNATYDYIVAGAGTAGIVTAERLASSGASVLLLERGGPSFFMTGNRKTMPWNDTVTMYDVPGMADFTGASPDLQYCRDLSIAAGCLLGGSTMLNALMFVKPRREDYEAWPKEWQWDNGVAHAADALYERHPGTILASQDGKRYDDAAFDIMSEFLDKNGWTEGDALHNPENKEKMYSHPPWSIARGLRDSPVRAILPDAQRLPNFTLDLHTKVLRATRKGGLITGVEVESESGARELIRLARGGSLVLAAGSHSTPRILFNSGIGPASQIEIVASGKTNITLPPRRAWIDLPVGKKLQDHPIAAVNFVSKKPFDVLPPTAWTKPSQANIDLFAQGSGLLAQSGQRLVFWTSVTASDGRIRHVQGTVRGAADNTINVKVYLTHGLTSTGSLAIREDGTTYMPESPLLNTRGDVEALTGFIETLLAGADREGSVLAPRTNATAAELVAAAGSGSHYLGTARMGETDDGDSVVDADTRVWRTRNLFVVDASMHPHVPTGNTAGPVMVAAAYAAERILQLRK